MKSVLKITALLIAGSAIWFTARWIYSPQVNEKTTSVASNLTEEKKKMNITQLSETEPPLVVKSDPNRPVSKWIVHLPPPWNLPPDTTVDHFLLRGADGMILWAGGMPSVIVLNDDGAFRIVANSQIKVYRMSPQFVPSDPDNYLLMKLEQYGILDPAAFGPIINWREYCPNVSRDTGAGLRSNPPLFEIEDVSATAHGFEFKLKTKESPLRIKVVVSTNPMGFVSCSEI